MFQAIKNWWAKATYSPTINLDGPMFEAPVIAPPTAPNTKKVVVVSSKTVTKAPVAKKTAQKAPVKATKPATKTVKKAVAKTPAKKVAVKKTVTKKTK